MSVVAAKVADRLAGGLALGVLKPLRFLQDLFGEEKPLDAVREIVAVKFWGIGNAALMLPVLQALKRRYPAARLTVVTLEENRPILRAVADRVLCVRMRPVPATALDLVRVAAVLHRIHRKYFRCTHNVINILIARHYKMARFRHLKNRRLAIHFIGMVWALLNFRIQQTVIGRTLLLIVHGLVLS